MTSYLAQANVINILSQLVENIDPVHIKWLAEQRRGNKKSGELIFNTNQPNNLYQLSALLHEMGGKDTIEFIIMMPEDEDVYTWLTRKSPLFKGARDYLYLLRETLQTEITVSKGMYTCGKCKGKNTISLSKQTRSGDEGSTVFVTCLTCGNRFKG